MQLKDSQTKVNLMRAFAGESQARNRYEFAASQAKQLKLHVVEHVFKFTADQEKEHAEVFYNLLKELAGENIAVDGNYPIDLHDDIQRQLESAHHNEYQEYEHDYAAFANVAKQEGFAKVSAIFQGIAAIEKTHGDRFMRVLDFMQRDRLFTSENEVSWMCLNCGHIHTGTSAPQQCPICSHDQGYFIRTSWVPIIGE